MQLKPYPKYKDSGVQWIGEIPEGWEVRRIKSLIPFIKNGQWGDEPKNNMLDLIVLRVEDFDGRYFNLNKDLTIRNVPDLNLSLMEDDLVIEKSGGGEKQLVGRVVQLKNCNKNEKYTYSNFIGKLIIKENINKDFLNYYFNVLYNSKVNHKYIKQTTGIQNLDTDLLIQREFFGLPSGFHDQTAIVSFLDKKTAKIDALIEKDKNLIAFLEEKRTALINHAVTKELDPNVKLKNSGIPWIGKIPEGWKVRKLKQVTSIMISNVDKKSKPNEEEVLLCNYNEVYNNEFITSKLSFMKATASIEQIEKFSIKKEDVIITKDSEIPEDIAVPSLVKENLDNIICGYHLALIRPNESKIKGKYLLRVFQSRKINDQFVISANGVTRFGISTYPIKNSFVIIPPPYEQTVIASYLDKATAKIDETIEKIEKEIALLEEYKKSLIHHVVTGKVDVRGVEA